MAAHEADGARGAVDPSRAQFAAFQALPGEGAVHMINLIRLRPLAAYAPDHPRHGGGDTGQAAYRAYGRAAAPPFARAGGRQVWLGAPQLVLIGPDDERWHLAFIAAYPSAEAFTAMLRDPEYREAVKHRQAAVADSRLIRTAPQRPGEGFGEG